VLRLLARRRPVLVVAGSLAMAWWIGRAVVVAGIELASVAR